ncbi:MAG: polyphosphate kinase 1 [Fibrobacterota bacterium]
MSQILVVKKKNPVPEGLLIHKELSWLLFNERVLEEARDQRHPLLDRLRFLGIYSNNLDEFYRVRVANLRRTESDNGPNFKIGGLTVRKLLQEVGHRAHELTQRFEEAYETLERDLVERGIKILDEKQLTPQQEAHVKQVFHEKVRPRLVPILLARGTEFPLVHDHVVHLAVRMIGTKHNKPPLSIIEIPDTLPRFVELPSDKNCSCVILVEDVVRWGLPEIFGIFQPKTVESWAFKVTRDAELDLEDSVGEGFLRRVHMGLRKRATGVPVRVVYDRDMPSSVQTFIINKLGTTRIDARIPGMRQHNFKDFMKFPRLGRRDLSSPSLVHVAHPRLSGTKRILQEIQRKDQLLHFPWHDFSLFLDFLREAAIDPEVTHIRLTVYRVSSESSVLNALVNAARNGKKVTVLMEVLARFDEENNIQWADYLRDEGVEVIPGVRGLKVHSKLCLVSRRDGSKVRHYAAVGTGNFNEDTAQVYTAHMLLTSDPRITDEVALLFEFFRNNYKVPRFRQLVVSPFGSREHFLDLVRAERDAAIQGKPAWISLRLNNLADEELILALCEASQAGATVRILVRGMNCLMPGIPGISDKLEVRGLVGRFLEHSRMLSMANGGKPRVWITSGDWMSRNMDGRVEVACPIHEKKLRDRLLSEFEMQWKDTCNARVWNPDEANRRVQGAKFDSHVEIPKWLAGETD